jgi:hypothetical protein
MLGSRAQVENGALTIQEESKRFVVSTGQKSEKKWHTLRKMKRGGKRTSGVNTTDHAKKKLREQVSHMKLI